MNAEGFQDGLVISFCDLSLEPNPSDKRHCCPVAISSHATSEMSVKVKGGNRETVCPQKPQLSNLPPEIFEIILPQVGGYAFVSLRRTCRRIKMLADDLEMRLTPCIWYRYVHSDFSKACVESVMPWQMKNEGKLKDNVHYWKMMYSGLQSSLVQHKNFICKRVEFSTDLEGVTNVWFAGSQIFVYSYNIHLRCVGLKSGHQSQFLSPITDLRYYEGNGHTADIRCLAINHPDFEHRVIYKPFSMVDQANPAVQDCRRGVQSGIQCNFTKPFFADEALAFCSRHKMDASLEPLGMMLSQLPARISRMTTAIMHYHDGISLCAFGHQIKFCRLVVRGSSPTLVYSDTKLPQPVKTLRRLEDLLVVVVRGTFNNVFTNGMHVDDRSGKVIVGAWNQLRLPAASAPDQVTGETVCDADVLGNALVLVTDLGNVYLSSVQDPSHAAIQRKLSLAYQMERLPPNANYCVSLDLNNGFVIAVLKEQANRNEIILLFAT